MKLYQASQIFLILLLLVALAVSVQASQDQFSQNLGNLSHEDAKIRGQAAWTLGKSGDSRAVGPLIQALKDKDRDVRQWAELALVKIGRPAVEELIFVLENENESICWQAAAALGLINDSRAVQPLISALSSTSSETRYWSAVSLGILGNSWSKEQLISALGDENQSVRGASGLALFSIEGQAATETLIQMLQDNNVSMRLGAAEALAGSEDSRAVLPLIGALQDDEAEVRAASAGALGEINDSRAVNPLIMMLEDNDSIVRSRAIDAIVNIGRAASPALIQALQNESGLIRQGSAKALGKIKEEKAFEPLIVAFRDKEMRDIAVQAIVNIDKSGAVTPFIRILEDQNQSSDMRADAAWALGVLDDSRANGPLLQALAGKDRDVSGSAARALREIKGG